MRIVLSGSVAYDYLMTFPGRFKDHILLERLERLSLSFLVDSMVRQRGGIAANIGYTLALLGERPTVLATVGQDFADYRQVLDDIGVDTSGIVVIPDLFTASFFVNTDETNAQIASFYSGAMARACDLHIRDLAELPEWVVISANDPEAMDQHIAECAELGIPYVYDPSQQTVRLSPEPLAAGIRGCHSLFVNDYEFDLIREKTGLDVDEILKHSQQVVITLGEHGADIHHRQGKVHIEAVEPETILDPTGVGDAFRAGFFKGQLHGLSLERCGQMGALAATYCLEADGPQGHQFTPETFVQRFRQHFDDQGELDSLWR